MERPPGRGAEDGDACPVFEPQVVLQRKVEASCQQQSLTQADTYGAGREAEVVFHVINAGNHQQVEQVGGRQGHTGAQKSPMGVAELQQHDEDNIIKEFHHEVGHRVAAGQGDVGHRRGDGFEEHGEHGAHDHRNGRHEVGCEEQAHQEGQAQDEEYQERGNEQQAYLELVVYQAVSPLYVIHTGRQAGVVVVVHAHHHDAGVRHRQHESRRVEPFIGQSAALHDEGAHGGFGGSHDDAGQHERQAQLEHVYTLADGEERKRVSPPGELL